MSSSGSERLVVVHDVLGTLFGLEAPIEALQSIFAEQLKAMNAPAIFAELIIMVRLMTLLVIRLYIEGNFESGLVSCNSKRLYHIEYQ